MYSHHFSNQSLLEPAFKKQVALRMPKIRFEAVGKWFLNLYPGFLHSRCGTLFTVFLDASFSQLFSGPLLFFFFGGCPTKMVFPKKGFHFFQGH